MQIHELNGYSGALDDAYMAVDDGSDTGKKKIKDITDPLNARIDNIIAGPASSAQEVIDARRGADGLTYASLGDAIRTQVSNLGDDMDNNFGFYEVLTKSLPADSLVEQYWNIYLDKPIKTGAKLHLELLNYTGTKLVGVRFIAYNTSNNTTVLLNTSLGSKFADIVAQEDYTRLWIQAERTEIENEVSLSVLLKSNTDAGVGRDFYNAVSKDGLAEVSINNTQFFKTKNIFDTNDIIEGYVLNNINPVANASYFYTKPIYNIIAEEAYIASCKNIAWQCFVNYYNENGTRTGGTVIGNISGMEAGFTIPAGTAFVRFSANLANKDYIQIEKGNVVSPFETFGTVAHPTVSIEGVPINYTVEKNGGGDFDSLVNCINYINDNGIMDAIVHVGSGVWDLISELGQDYLNAVGSSKRGLYLQNRVHVICSSEALITCNYTGSRAETIEWLCAFNAGPYGFTLENARIESSKCRYTIHDERDVQTDTYTNKYINCFMRHDNSNGGNAQVIGGGLGKDGHIIIDGCVFENPHIANRSSVSYHNTWYAGGDGRSTVEVKGCYFKGTTTFRCSWFGPSQEITSFLVHDNSLGKAIEHVVENQQMMDDNPSWIQNTELLAWNNEIR